MTSPDLLAKTISVDADIARGIVSSAIGLANSGRPHTGHIAIFDSPNRLVAGIGVAARLRMSTGDDVSVRSVSRLLRSISHSRNPDHPGSAPMAIGALAFDPAEDGELVVPEMTFVRTLDGTWSVTLVGTGDLGLPMTPEDSAGDSPPSASESEISILESGDVSFTEAVTTALCEIAAGHVQKVVIARRAVVELARRIDVASTIASLRERESSSSVFAITTGRNTFLGASPELLVARNARIVTSIPLAGSARLTGDNAADRLAIARMEASEKEMHEHHFVVDAVSEVLSQVARLDPVPAVPAVLGLRQIAHLATKISGTLEEAGLDTPSALELACRLNPTPAVGGSPTAEALALIRELEKDGRDLFAGPVGWVDAGGDGEFVIGIRSAQVDGATACVRAGTGIVIGSDPAEELVETSLKLDTMLGALRAR